MRCHVDQAGCPDVGAVVCYGLASMLLLKYCSVALDWTAWFDSATVKFDKCFNSSFTWQSFHMPTDYWHSSLEVRGHRHVDTDMSVTGTHRLAIVTTTDISTVNHLTSSTDQYFLSAVKIGSGLIGASVVIMAIA